jgi:hypothetical protein
MRTDFSQFFQNRFSYEKIDRLYFFISTLSALENGSLPEIGINRLMRILNVVLLDIGLKPSNGRAARNA